MMNEKAAELGMTAVEIRQSVRASAAVGRQERTSRHERL